eukprot:6138940-Alexandrium_andersonii.AAC.1
MLLLLLARTRQDEVNRTSQAQSVKAQIAGLPSDPQATTSQVDRNAHAGSSAGACTRLNWDLKVQSAIRPRP